MEFTGERFLPSVSGVIAYEHWHRYAAVASLVAGKRVLDAACGEGYGAALLAGSAAEVVGVDAAAEVVEHAARTYAGQAGLSFRAAALPSLPFEDASFDAVVSFETLEHVPDAAASFAELKRVLRPGGLLVASTPDREVYSGKQGNRNGFHTHEMDRAEFEALCRGHFAHVAIVGQRVYLASVIGPSAPGRSGPVDCFGLVDGRPVPGAPAVAEATYLLCFCSDRPLPDRAGAASAFLDNDAAAQGERETLMGWAQTMKQERDASAEESREAIGQRDALADQIDLIRHERDIAVEETLQLRQSLHEMQRRQAKAIEQVAQDVADLRSDRFLHRVTEAATAAATARLEEDRRAREDDRHTLQALMASDVVAPLRAAQEDLTAQLGALGRMRTLDLEAVRSALDHDRIVLETVLARLDAESEARQSASRLQNELDAVRESTSWRLTAPLRVLGQRLARRR